MDEEKKENNYTEPEDNSTKPEDNYKEPEKKYEKIDKPEIVPKKIGSLTDKLRANPFILSTAICGVLAVFLLVVVLSGSSGGITGKVVSEEVAGNNLIGFLNEVADSEVTLLDIEDSGSLYKVLIEFMGKEMPVYVTKDGSFYTTTLLPLVTSTQEKEDKPSQDIPKSDKPKVELFVMTHCPYGTQAEKGMIPVLNLLGDKIDGNIRFVHYFMHKQPGQEPDETPRQVCIREEQSDKYLDYLACFLGEGDAETCLVEVGINTAELSECIDNRADGYYEEDSGLSEGYGVRGSPTLVINGKIVNSARDSAAYLDTICQAFNDAPSECGNELSSEASSPGFGYSASSSSGSSASCG